MLAELRIANLAIIEELTVSFGPGLNVITGETGAGKSILIEALTLLLGDRASVDLIRTNEETAEIEAVFLLPENGPVKEKLAAMGIDAGEELFARRLLSRTGRSRVYLNGTSVSLAMLADVMAELVSICGQHEHQAILSAARHIDILDEYAGLASFNRDYGAVFRSWREAIRKFESAKKNAFDLEKKGDYLRYALAEIQAAAIIPGEDEALAQERLRLLNAVKLKDLAHGAFDILHSRQDSILASMSRVNQTLKEILKLDPLFNVSPEEGMNLYYRIEDMARSLRDYGNRLTDDPERLETLQERMELLGRLKKKHGGSLGAVEEKSLEFARELAAIESADEQLGELDHKISLLREEVLRLGGELSRMRTEAAGILGQAVEGEIRSLNMAGAKFEVVVESIPSTAAPDNWTEKGGDRVEFFLSANPGEGLKPLTRVASGGELSRIILGIKKALARVASTGAIVFDEVDSGIGGDTARKIGKMLRETAGYQQVLCISHLPQIACFGHNHYQVTKKTVEGRTSTSVRHLAPSERREELARMLGGLSLTEKTLAHAQDLLEGIDKNPEAANKAQAAHPGDQYA